MSWYNSGTVAATNNNTVVNGTGTLFLANVRIGDGITIAGSTALYEVTNVASNTQLSITPAYAATTGSGKSFSIVPVQGYVKDLADQAKALILALGGSSSNANVTALMAVVGAANSFPYFTSGTAMAAATLSPAARAALAITGAADTFTYYTSPTAASAATITAAARSLLDDADVAAMRTTLGIAGAADTLTYSTGPTTVATTPLTAAARALLDDGDASGMRTTLGLKSASLADAIGTVSQTSGVPTGAIMEFGSNANGQYWKFASGLMICTRYEDRAMTLTTMYGSTGYSNYAWTYPVAFVGTIPTTSVCASLAGRITYSGPVGGNQTLNSTSWFFTDPLGASSGTYAAQWTAIGRWF